MGRLGSLKNRNTKGNEHFNMKKIGLAGRKRLLAVRTFLCEAT